MVLFPTSAAEWPAQKKHIEERIASHHLAMESADSEQQLRQLQGQIASLRWLLSEAEPKQIAGAGPGKY